MKKFLHSLTFFVSGGLCVIAILGLFYVFTHPEKVSSLLVATGLDPRIVPVAGVKNCKDQGMLSQDRFLQTYEVQAGQTLTSVAQQALGDVSRVEELVKLNQDLYPNLTTQAPLEAGWKLYLPPTNLGRTNGNIFAVAGQVSISNVGWGVSWQNAGVGPFDLAELPANIPNNRCAVVIYEGGDLTTGTSLRVSSVQLQN